ncbi:MAG: hypothetical protein ALECFALPRED_010165, partial [Alectoria fallacina]
MSTTPEPGGQRRRDQSHSPPKILPHNLERSSDDPSLIASLQQTIAALKQTKTSIKQLDVEIGVVVAFISNLERRGRDRTVLVDLLVQLREVGGEFQDKLNAILPGLERGVGGGGDDSS